MKYTIKNIFQKEKMSFWNYFDIAYALVAIVFIIICVYKLVVFLMDHYSFVYLCVGFWVLTLIYVFWIFTQAWGKESWEKAIKKIHTSHPFIAWIIENKDIWFYGIFLVFTAFFICNFFVWFDAAFGYMTYIVMGAFLLYKLVWGSIQSWVSKDTFEQKTFLKILILSLSAFLVCVSMVFQGFGVSDHKNIVLLSFSLVYIILFTFFFSNIFSNVTQNKVSRKQAPARWTLTRQARSSRSKSFLANNTYNILSGICISIIILILLGKNGAFSTLWETIFSYIPWSDSSSQRVIDPDRVREPAFQEDNTTPTLTIEKPLRDIFEFNGFTQLWSAGTEVTKLQEALTLLGYYDGELSGEYDEATKEALTQVLVQRCDWPDTTRWIFWPQAQQCLYSLSVQFDVDGSEAQIGLPETLPTQNTLPVSDEAIPVW